eukprot:2592141-Rhodomonas_salina.1
MGWRGKRGSEGGKEGKRMRRAVLSSSVALYCRATPHRVRFGCTWRNTPCVAGNTVWLCDAQRVYSAPKNSPSSSLSLTCAARIPTAVFCSRRDSAARRHEEANSSANRQIRARKGAEEEKSGKENQT